MQNQICFLLSYFKYGDNDAILNCYGKEIGFITVFAKGIYASKNRKKAYLFPLNQIIFTIPKRQNSSSLPMITQIENAENTYDFDDVHVNTILFFISDFLRQVLKEETYSVGIYNEIEKFLIELFNKNLNSYIPFIFNILTFQGISPSYESNPFFNPETGNFDDTQVHELFDEEISNIWKSYLLSENGYNIILTRDVKRKTLESLMYYYRIHFTGFFEPHSLEIIQQIFV